ncbi:MAG: hypothetical protein KIG74_01965 [Clostridiaceae bacterium]|nr:hypothetical protein [Clostridiaceae bacterium]
MKKCMACLLAAGLLLCLTACAGAPESQETPKDIPPIPANTNEIDDANDPGSANEPADGTPPQGDSTVRDENTSEKAEEAAKENIDVTGPWLLESKNYVVDGFWEAWVLFPGYGVWGAGLEIRSDGEMNWYIGAESWQGTYTLGDGVLHAQLTSDLEQTTQLWEFRVVTEKETPELEMEYQGMTIFWTPGEQPDPANGADIE